MRTLAKSLCVRWPSVNARAGQILCVPTIDKYFHKKRKINKILPIKRKDIKKLSKKDRENLHKYFKDLEFRKPNVIHLGEINFDEDND
jgi:hypothetical protein